MNDLLERLPESEGRERAEILSALAHRHWVAGQTTEALQALDAARDIFQEIDSLADVAACDRNAAFVLLGADRPTEALARAELAAAEFRAALETVDAAGCDRYAALALRSLGRREPAKRRLRSAIAALAAMQASCEMGLCLAALVEILLEQGRFGAAHRTLRRALRLLEGAVPLEVVARCSLALGQALRFLGRLEEAAVQLAAARAQFDAANHDQGRALTEVAEMELGVDIGTPDVTLELADHRWDGCREINDPEGVAWSHFCAGRALIAMHDYEPAVHRLNAAEAIFGGLRHEEGLAASRYVRAQALCQLGRHREALSSLRGVAATLSRVGRARDARGCRALVRQLAGELPRRRAARSKLTCHGAEPTQPKRRRAR